jgi:hypothetical protein
MRLPRLLLAVLSLAVVASVALVAQQEPSGLKMARAARGFLETLNDEQRAQTIFPFDHPERYNWHFVPLQDQNRKPTRKGLSLEAMNAKQRNAALELIRSGLSLDGFRRATTIMSLEEILREQEKGGTLVRDPDWYFFTIFGDPGATGRWGWRVEGHHLSLNFTIENGQVVAATPMFLGANPATVMEGPRKGLRILAASEDLARDLFRSLNEEQRKLAFVTRHFPEVKAQNRLPEVGPAVGLPASQMTAAQRDTLSELLKAYLSSMPPDFAAEELRKILEKGLDHVHFAWSGGTDPGQERTYRIQGPTFLVEFLNVQPDSARNPANHIHSCWRSLSNDFGLASAKN